MGPLNPTDEKQLSLEPVQEEAIDRAADELLELYREAFEELAK